MVMTTSYTRPEPARSDIDLQRGPTLLEFGTPWCGYCMAAQALLAQALAPHPVVNHIKVEDGKGQALGRSFQVKLWPTLIFMRDGQEMVRLVRPDDAAAISRALKEIDQPT